jgi:hypothetical protein
MNISEFSTQNWAMLRATTVLLLVICLPGLTQAQSTSNQYVITRTFGTSANDWAEIGSFANNGTSQYMLITVQGHWCGGIISAQFRYDDIAYTGASSNWMELPVMGGKIYSTTQPVAIDIRRANPGSTSDPILARVRNLYGMCGGTSLTISIESNAVYTATTNTGSSGTVDAGYAASNLGWKFPVATDGHSASTNGLFVLNTGNVGTGTITPSRQLHVYGGGQATANLTDAGNKGGTLYVQDSGGGVDNGGAILLGSVYGSHAAIKALVQDGSGNSTGSLAFSLRALAADTALTQRMVITSTGNVGIGTTNPGYPLDVKGTISLGNSNLNAVTPRFITYDDGFNASYTTYGVDAVTRYKASNPFYWMSVPAGTTRLSDAGTLIMSMVNGNVTIGTPTANASLDVNGSINVSGNINAKYQDVAEWVTTSKDLPEASVVVLDPNHSNQVTTSIKGYDTRVAGVVSGKPGLVLGEGGAGKAMIATVGRVKVRVDATRQPIHVGDLLVTGTLEGTAMKSEPVNVGGVEMHRPGTLIGKALEPLEKGTGEILVLLSLQ